MESARYILEDTRSSWKRVIFSVWLPLQFTKYLSRELEKNALFKKKLAVVSDKVPGRKGKYIYLQPAAEGQFSFILGQLWQLFHLDESSKEQSSLEKVVGEYLGADWLFTGQGLFWLGQLNPDFLYLGSSKKVIECLGHQYHKPESAQQKIVNHKGFGFSTLCIWSFDVSGGKYKHMIKDFMNQ